MLLKIFTGLVTPEHVVQRGLVEVLVDVVESVLGDVTDDQVGVLPHLTRAGLSVTDNKLDEGRLTRTVRAENGDTRGERELDGDTVELGSGGLRVLEDDVLHLDERLLLGLDTVERGGLGSLKA